MLRNIRSGFMLAALAAAFAGPALAQELPQEGPVPTTALINVESKNAVELDPRALNLQVNGHDTPINSLTHASSGNVEIAILIDEGLRSSSRSSSMTSATSSTACHATTRFSLATCRTGPSSPRATSTADHQEISNQLRLTMSIPGSSASPYFCLSDFVKHWPSEEPAARFVLMLTNGVDPDNAGRRS